jgi:serine/threonine-protein kinase BUR1
MFVRKPILPGSSDLDQVERIYSLCGTPNQHTWPNHDRLPGCEGVTRFAPHVRQLRMVYQQYDEPTAALIPR